MKVGIVGTGFVGSTAAYAMVMNGIGREIVLVDKNAARANAEADDIQHAVPFAHPLQLRAGNYDDLTGAQVVIITAGVNQRPGENRLQLLERNAAVFKEVVPEVIKYAPNAVLVVATNPVDIMTHIAAFYAAGSGMPATRVIGSGTTLDTARFRALLGGHLGIDSQHIHGYVIGEHGDSEVLVWSLVTIGGIPLEEFCSMQQIVMDNSIRTDIDRKVRFAAQGIISGKGATYYGIGSALSRIVEIILHDQRSILTVSSQTAMIEGISQVTVSLPHLVGGEGILNAYPLPLNEEERKLLQSSAKIVQQVLEQLNL